MATFQEIQELASNLNNPSDETQGQPADAAVATDASEVQAEVPADAAAPAPMSFRPSLPPESKEFAELARRERVARETEERNKNLSRELSELRGEVRASRGVSENDLRAEARRDPLGFIKKHGLSYEDLTNTVLNGEKAPQSLEMRNEIEQLRGEMAEIKDARIKEKEANTQASQEAAYNKFIDEVDNFIENNSSDCELIKLQGAQQLVGEVIRDNYVATGKAMPYEQACSIVEDHLEKQVRNAMRSSKFTHAVEAPPPEAAPQEEETQVSTRPKTLTNQNTASPAHVGDGVVRQKLASRDESISNLAKSLNFWG